MEDTRCLVGANSGERIIVCALCGVGLEKLRARQFGFIDGDVSLRYEASYVGSHCFPELSFVGGRTLVSIWYMWRRSYVRGTYQEVYASSPWIA